jgi:hypothetical protein
VLVFWDFSRGIRKRKSAALEITMTLKFQGVMIVCFTSFSFTLANAEQRIN